MKKIFTIIFTILSCLALLSNAGRPAEAQEENDYEFTLEEITVTAQKREENLQKVPVAIEAVTGDELTAMGKVDFKDLKLTLKAAEGAATAVTINYGAFLNTIIDFVIVAFALFMVIRTMNRLKKKEAAAPAAPAADVVLLTEIRDLLKK